MLQPEIVIAEPDELARRFAARFATDAATAIAERGRFAIALPGGSAATSFFPTLARAAVDWTHVDFFWGDERAVAPDDPESNYGIARKLWLVPAGVPEARVHRMKADSADLEEASRSYEAELLRVLGTPPRLDMAVMGVGPDGHVCSLFPGHALLAEAGRFVAAIEDSPKPPPRRMTLTLSAVAATRLLVVAATGAGKAGPIREAVKEAASALPLALAMRGAPKTLLLLDAAAASLL